MMIKAVVTIALMKMKKKRRKRRTRRRLRRPRRKSLQRKVKKKIRKKANLVASSWHLLGRKIPRLKKSLNLLRQWTFSNSSQSPLNLSLIIRYKSRNQQMQVGDHGQHLRRIHLLHQLYYPLLTLGLHFKRHCLHLKYSQSQFNNSKHIQFSMIWIQFLEEVPIAVPLNLKYNLIMAIHLRSTVNRSLFQVYKESRLSERIPSLIWYMNNNSSNGCNSSNKNWRNKRLIKHSNKLISFLLINPFLNKFHHTTLNQILVCQ